MELSAILQQLILTLYSLKKCGIQTIMGTIVANKKSNVTLKLENSSSPKKRWHQSRLLLSSPTSS